VPFVIIQPRRIRESLKMPVSIGVDLLVLVVVCGVIGALFSFGRQIAAPYQQNVKINLSLWALPKYTMFSLARGFAAYALSLLFTLAYGTIAAHNRRAERVLIPALDVLQSLPVLAFLPEIVLAMIRLFPAHELGLEMACIITIFTAQAWNMTFSYYSSVKQIPNNLREVAAVHHLSRWQVFRLLELPASMIGLVWNSMMSMAGGWFVLNVSEAFPIGTLKFSLPGIGSYMSQANLAGDLKAQIGGVIAMVLMIVAVDQLFWRPIVVWSERFKVEETSQSEKARSWVLTLLKHSALYPRIVQQVHLARQRSAARLAADGEPAIAGNGNGVIATLTRRRISAPNPNRFARLLLTRLTLALMAVCALWGAWKLIGLLCALPLHDPAGQGDWEMVILGLLASFARVLLTVFLGAAWTLPAGILIGLSSKWSQRLQPIVQVMASFPANMIYLPLTLLLLRLGIPFNIGCVALMMLGTQWYVLFNVIAGAMAIPTELKEVGTVYDTPRWRRWTRIYIPGVFPHLVTGLITAAGGAWNTTIIAEYVFGSDRNYIAFGVGAMITQALNDDPPNFPLLASGAVALAASVVIINRLMWRRLYRLAERRYSLEV
jgi:NitT/TauT family transport system permease protein